MKQLLLLPLLFITVISFGQTNNYSLEFDWVNGYVDCGDPNELKVTGPITYMAWVKSIQFSNWSGIVGRSQGGASNPQNIGSSLMISPYGKVIFEMSDGSTINQLYSSSTLILDTLYHIAVTWDGTNSNTSMKIFINGIMDTSNISSISNININIPSSTQDNRFKIGLRDFSSIGSDSLYGYHNGTIDDVSVWDIALSQQEVQSYMNCSPTGTETGLVGYWNFEEGTGTTTADQSSNGNDGALSNGVTWSTDVPPYSCCTPNPITSQPTNQSTTIGNNATISFTDNLTGATYQWQIDAGTGYSDLSNAGQFSGTDTQTLTISTTTMSNNNTLYRCIVTESSNCMDTTDVSTLTVIDNTSINELDNSLVKLFPNPTSDQITIDIKGYSGVVNVEVYDLQGRLLETTTNNVVSLKNHAKGIYVLKVSYGEITEEVRVVRD